MSVYQNSVLAFIQVLETQSKIILIPDWNELQQLSSQLPKDDEEIVEVLENWLQPKSRSQLLEAYKHNLELLAAEFPIKNTNIGIANSQSKTTPNQPSESSQELIENAINKNSPLLSEKEKSQQKP